MAFKHFARQTQGVELLQRSLARGRLGHAYLFAGDQLEELELLARTLAKTLNCRNAVKTDDVATDCCDTCLNCQKIDRDTHADVHWARPESKSRIVTVEQMRELMREIQLKPTEAEYKVAIIAGADRLNAQAANAFLKTLEEPPGRVGSDFAFDRTAADFRNHLVALSAPEFLQRRGSPAGPGAKGMACAF